MLCSGHLQTRQVSVISWLSVACPFRGGQLPRSPENGRLSIVSFLKSMHVLQTLNLV